MNYINLLPYNIYTPVNCHTCPDSGGVSHGPITYDLSKVLLKKHIDPDETAHNEPCHLDLRCLTFHYENTPIQIY